MDFTQKPQKAEWLDFDKLTFPLGARPWREGDWFIPFGMKGRKNISDFLNEKKIPLHRKKDVWVLTSGEDIAYILGYRIDERFKISSSTVNIYQLKPY
jgi:tRNA(Ile)-lysidine synthase